MNLHRLFRIHMACCHEPTRLLAVACPSSLHLCVVPQFNHHRSIRGGMWLCGTCDREARRGTDGCVSAHRSSIEANPLNFRTPSLSAVDDGRLTAADFSRLLSYNPSRRTVMVDYSPSEFSRFRVQLARDQSRPGVTDSQLFLQYIMSLGVHGAHSF